MMGFNEKVVSGVKKTHTCQNIQKNILPFKGFTPESTVCIQEILALRNRYMSKLYLITYIICLPTCLFMC